MREYRYLCATKVLCGFGRCSGRRERCEVNGWGFAREKLCHDVCSGRGEEDAVAIVAGGKEMSWFGWQGAEEWKTVGSCGAEACPGFELRGVGKGGK
jgi:hypothetical protein